ncbi:MAG TPA: sigma-70 family RNA polymerase sigma factor [Candidatus Acidoferrum sp.]|nr:sigma-70 family RNA polymerase sigma factor [Candidatus Acidoferrum sp.]
MNPATPQPSEVRATSDYDSLPTRKSLLSRLRDLDDAISWRAFFDTYWRLIYNVARKSGLCDEDAQDVVQETVIAVARKMPEFRYDPAKGSFKLWLLLITRRRIHDHLRKLYRSLPISEAASGQAGHGLEKIASPALPPDAAIEAAWEQEWRENIFQGALARVRARANPKSYQVFDYAVLQNLPAAEVGRMLGLNAAQVYLARHRMSAAVKRAAAAIETELNQSDA